ncbi:MAG: T9SS type A sorting domain-containing protein [Ignavibacteriae bacterium]|nr:T9SS type A sorting domain-containing protein [Ignavibacteriota bacterium]
MKNILTVLLAVLAFLIVNITFNVNNSYAQWQSDVRLTNDTYSSWTSYNAAWCIASNGNVVHAVWYDNRDGNDEIYYKRSADGGTNWGSDTRLTYDVSASQHPSVAVSGLLVHVVWRDSRDGNIEIYYKRSLDGGINCGADTRLTNDTAYSYRPSLSVSGSLVQIVWYDYRNGNNDIYYKRSTDGGINCGTDMRLTNDPASSVMPSVAVSGSTIHIVWQDSRDGNSEIYYKRSTDGGSTWGTDTRLTNNPAPSYYPSVAVSGSGVHVVWFDDRDGNNEIYYKRSSDGGLNWDVDTRLTNDPAYSGVPNIAVSGTNVHFVWQDQRDGNHEIYYKCSSDGGLNWGADTRLTNNSSVSTQTSISISGSVIHVIWVDLRDGNQEIYYKRNPTGNITEIKNISSEFPDEFKLMQNYPNPFNPVTKIRFDIPVCHSGEGRNQFVSIIIYDALGREVETLVNEVQSAGSYSVDFNASNLSGGVYFCRMQSAGFTDVTKLVLLK